MIYAERDREYVCCVGVVLCCEVWGARGVLTVAGGAIRAPRMVFVEQSTALTGSIV